MDSPSSEPGWSRLDALLDQALELPIERRDTLLERVGREDPALRARVEQLLAADAAAGDFLNDGAEAWLHSGPLTPAHRAEQVSLLAKLVHERVTSPRVGDLLDAAADDPRDDAVANVREAWQARARRRRDRYDRG